MPRRKGPSLDRQQVVAAAIACIEADGPAALAITPVARRLGIKPPSLYNHVKGADDLALAVLIEANHRMVATMRAGIGGVYEPRAVLAALAASLRQFALANPGLYQTISQIPPQNDHPELGPLIFEVLDFFRRPLAQLGITGDEAIHAIRALRSAMHGFVLLETSGQFGLGQSTDESYSWLVQTTLRGLEAR